MKESADASSSPIPASVRNLRTIFIVAALSYLVNNVLNFDNIFSDVPGILRPLGETFAIILWQFRFFGPPTILIIAASLFTKPRFYKAAFWLAFSGIILIVAIAMVQVILRFHELQTSSTDFGPHPYLNLALGIVMRLLPWILVMYLLLPFRSSFLGTSTNYPARTRLPLLLVCLIIMPLLLYNALIFFLSFTVPGFL